jgi:hypothetical protein
MYPGQSKNIPAWVVVVAGLLLVFGGYYIWRGVIAFFESNGNITAPATYAVSQKQTPTESQDDVGTLDFSQVAPVAAPTQRVCQDFRVSVIRARVRDCPKDTCETISTPGQGTKICVYGPVPQAPDWYEINISPDEPLPRTGYMHSSVLEALNPTKRPTQTFTPLPTVTPLPSLTPTRTLTPLPSHTPNPAVPATRTAVPTPTPAPPLQTA